VVELPVQDRAGLDELDLREVDLDAAPGEAVALGGVEDRLGRHAVAADPHRVANLGELGFAAVVGHHHAQRGGAAVGPLELLDERHGALAGGEAELLEGGEAFGDLLVVCHGWCPWRQCSRAVGQSGSGLRAAAPWARSPLRVSSSERS
jgi:hypothetical protein